MKYLLYYNSDSKFVTDQTNAGGDGTSVVSVVDGVAWTKDQEKAYYRYSNKSEDITTYALTVQYVHVDDVTGIRTNIRENTIYTISAYSGYSVDYYAQSKEVSGYTANETGAKLTITGNASYTFYYTDIIPENVNLRCYYIKTGDTTNIFKHVKYNPGSSSDDYTLFYNDIDYLLVDGVRVEKTDLTKIPGSGWQSAFTIGMAVTFTGGTNSVHKVEYVLKNKTNSVPGSGFTGIQSLIGVKFGNKTMNIGASCFSGCSNLTGVLLADNTIKIDDGCFAACPFSALTIPESVTTLGKSCFYSATSLVTMTIPNSVTALGSYCFDNCVSLSSVSIGNSITSLPDDCFSNCISISSITIPNSVTALGRYCFERCSSLTGITIPNTVTDIGGSCFYECSALKEVNLSTGLTYLSSGCFIRCTALSSITLTNLIKTIGSSCFLSAGLKNISLNNNLENIFGQAFYGCPLTGITLPNSLKYLGGPGESAGAFISCTGLTNITIPGSVKIIGGCCFRNCTNLTSVTINYGTKVIGFYCFDGCTNLQNQNITIPDSVTDVYSNAFNNSFISGCSTYGGFYYLNNVLAYKLIDKNSTNFTFKEGTKGLGPGCFQSNTGLTSITIPDGVEFLGTGCFNGCSSLSDVRIPDSVVRIGEACFNNTIFCSSNGSCPVYNGIYYPNNNVAYKATGTSMSNITIKDGTKSISDGCFRGFTNTSIKLVCPDSVEYLGRELFNTWQVKRGRYFNVSLGSGVTFLGGNSYYDSSPGGSELTITFKSPVQPIIEYDVFNHVRSNSSEFYYPKNSDYSCFLKPVCYNAASFREIKPV